MRPREMLLWAVVVVLVAAGMARARGIEVTVPHGALNGAPGDPVWQPTQGQVEAWIRAGVAAAEMYLPEMPEVRSCIWADAKGPQVGDVTLRFAVSGMPKLAAMVRGYQAAWMEVTWQRLQADEPEAVRQICQGVKRPAIEIRVAVGLVGKTDYHYKAAVWYDGAWRQALLSSPQPLTTYIRRGEVGAVMRQGMEMGYRGMQPAAEVSVAQVTMGARPGDSSRCPAPGPVAMSRDKCRVAIWSGDEFAWFDVGL